MPKTFSPGETIIIDVEFFNDQTGAPADPLSIAIHVKRPSSTVTYAYPGAQWTKLAVGKYEVRMPAIADPGVWIYEVEGDEVHEPGYLTVRNPIVA